jgi:hypothetical protein
MFASYFRSSIHQNKGIDYIYHIIMFLKLLSRSNKVLLLVKDKR